ncbi:hypothetical protein A2884_02250 [Candidatus Saccharibacteria bacterium RIFCSPHIGHO2_01_FULL_48_12]|nr:MAG: hypothetical protein A2884_02250 [Candidatus Saccharibacteria bacterium RIFCSPHIGHO2_01_FULL_48_12]
MGNNKQSINPQRAIEVESRGFFDTKPTHRTDLPASRASSSVGAFGESLRCRLRLLLRSTFSVQLSPLLAVALRFIQTGWLGL